MKRIRAQRGELETQLSELFRLLGFTLHKCCTDGKDGQDHMVGGLCLTPEPDGRVLVGWSVNSHHHAREAHEVREFHEDMLGVVSRALTRSGFDVEPGPLGRTVRVVWPNEHSARATTEETIA